MRNTKKRIFAAILAILLIVMMVIGMGASMLVHADSSLEAVAVSSSEISETSASVSEDAGKTASTSVGQEDADAKTQTASGTSGVYVENINVSGMSQTQIQSVIDRKMEALSDETIVMYAGDRSARVKAGDLGLTYTNRNLAAEAFSIGREGNVLKRFLADRYMENEGDIILDLDLTVSRDKVQEAITANEKYLNCEAQSNGLRLNKDYSFSMTTGRDGVKVNTDTSTTKLMDYMQNEWHGGQGGVALDAEITSFQDASQQLTLVKDLLGTGTTGYGTGDYNHDTNVEIAASHIDGTVLYPGEEFSAEEVIGPTTEEYGFLPGATYEKGKITESYGGGVCQVTSTLYNAVLQAELEVTERHNHSYLVSYVQPGFDAAIAEGLLDFRFKNNTDAPIYIQALTREGYLTFHIFGHETRDKNRTVSYESRQGESTEVETVFDTDPEETFGTMKVSGGIGGLDATLYKLITIDGETTEELENTSNYEMMPLTYTVGTKNADSQTIASINAAIATGELYEVQMAIGNGTVIEQEVMEN